MEEGARLVHYEVTPEFCRDLLVFLFNISRIYKLYNNNNNNKDNKITTRFLPVPAIPCFSFRVLEKTERKNLGSPGLVEGAANFFVFFERFGESTQFVDFWLDLVCQNL